MKCHKHEAKDAVCTCPDCGVWLCTECSKYIEFPICLTCNLKRLEAEKSGIHTIFLENFLYWSGLALFLFFYADVMRNFRWADLQTTILIGSFYVLFSLLTPYGWRFIDWLKWDTTVTIQINQWIIAVVFQKVFKLVAAMLIGCFVWPYQIWKMRKRLGTLDAMVSGVREAIKTY